LSDWFSHQIDSPYYFLIFGLIFFCLGVVWTFMGRAWGRYSWVYRSRDPIDFWLLVGVYYIAGIIFLGAVFF